MSFFEFPFTRTYNSDLAWLIKRVKMLIEDVLTQNQKIEDIEELVKNFIETLDIDQRIKDQIQALVDSGYFTELIAQIIEETLKEFTDAVSYTSEERQQMSEDGDEGFVSLPNVESGDTVKILDLTWKRTKDVVTIDGAIMFRMPNVATAQNVMVGTTYARLLNFKNIEPSRRPPAPNRDKAIKMANYTLVGKASPSSWTSYTVDTYIINNMTVVTNMFANPGFVLYRLTTDTAPPWDYAEEDGKIVKAPLARGTEVALWSSGDIFFGKFKNEYYSN